jgi:prepilin-type N-terminal cleavage/methylation domain-containing protein
MRTGRTRRAGRAGMTLIEVLVALVILAGSLVAMGNFMGKFTHAQKAAGLRQDAIDIATDLVDSVQHATTYASIPTVYGGTVTETRDNGTFTRVTTIKQMGGTPLSTVNYYIITTAVTPPDNLPVVKKTIAIRQF